VIMGAPNLIVGVAVVRACSRISRVIKTFPRGAVQTTGAGSLLYRLKTTKHDSRNKMKLNRRDVAGRRY